MKKLLLAGAAMVALASVAHAQQSPQGSNQHVTIGEVLRYTLKHKPQDGLANFSAQFESLCTGACFGCGRLFSYNPVRASSIRIA